MDSMIFRSRCSEADQVIRIENGKFDVKSQRALVSMLEACYAKIREMEAHLVKLTPVLIDKSWKKPTKALTGVWKTKQLKPIAEDLRRLFHVFVLSPSRRAS